MKFLYFSRRNCDERTHEGMLSKKRRNSEASKMEADKHGGLLIVQNFDYMMNQFHFPLEKGFRDIGIYRFIDSCCHSHDVEVKNGLMLVTNYVYLKWGGCICMICSVFQVGVMMSEVDFFFLLLMGYLGE